MPRIIIHKNGHTTEKEVKAGIILLEALRMTGNPPPSPCGGRGSCGKCRVIVNRGINIYTDQENKILSPEEMRKGIHLSCMIHVNDDIEVTLPDIPEKASILTSAELTEVPGMPPVTKEFFSLPVPSLSDQSPDDTRLFRTAYETTDNIIKNNDSFSDRSAYNNLPLEILQTLPEIMRNSGFNVTAIKVLDEITGVESGDTANTLYGIAVDIGTTTLAAYLYDIRNKKLLSVASLLNPQSKYGADVISRIEYTMRNEDNLKKMSSLIRSALNELINELAISVSIRHTDIYAVSLCGNTTMLHFALGLPARNISIAPFIPATLSSLLLKPTELNLSINPYGRVIVLPSVSAYVGADTVGAVLSTGMHDSNDISLLVDIGTNGEIVLGNKSFLYSCSAAAGPAFEGANISCGTGGVEGAISEVFVTTEGTLGINTIGNQKAVGICGSGLIDTIACMLDAGIIDETGRITDNTSLIPPGLRNRVIEINNQPAFILLNAGETASGEPIFITQKDVREVQNAKAAIAAGIKILADKTEIDISDIKHVYLAGGFGSFMRISSALRIGLLPKELSGRISAVGNAAGAGAIRVMLSKDEYIAARETAKRIKYVELSADPLFVDSYTDNMFFD
ncbi:MAG: DUF4445 domain-containing protein [Clostridiaceae bacterium]|nr:DUF4445 domain-containing protein [Clostridiaceae bacterium]